MNTPLDAIRNTRRWILQAVDGLSDAALNAIPEGFNNNIIWNLAHLVAAEQGVCYMRGRATPVVSPAFFQKYTRGTKPEGPVSAEEIAAIKAALTGTLDHLETDLAAGIFANYQTWTTPYGVELASIEDALQFLLFHEGMHCGYILALKRAVAASVPAQA